MGINLKGPAWGRNWGPFVKQMGGRGGRVVVLIIVISFGILIGLLPIFEAKTQETESWVGVLTGEERTSERLAMIEENSLLAISNPSDPEPQVAQKIKVVVTAYSSSPGETDDNPYLTAAGTWVREGIVANNMLPFGTKIRIPEIYGDKVFIVEDRMHWKKGYYHVDIWFASYGEAKDFGAKTTFIEVLES
jgi:3D (Asp-Asp-Asp) domain-containing protein